MVLFDNLPVYNVNIDISQKYLKFIAENDFTLLLYI